MERIRFSPRSSLVACAVGLVAIAGASTACTHTPTAADRSGRHDDVPQLLLGRTFDITRYEGRGGSTRLAVTIGVDDEPDRLLDAVADACDDVAEIDSRFGD